MEELEVPAKFRGDVVTPTMRQPAEADDMAGAQRAEELLLGRGNCCRLGVPVARMVHNGLLALWKVRRVFHWGGGERMAEAERGDVEEPAHAWTPPDADCNKCQERHTPDENEPIY